jgi:hypothetical protein
VAPEWDGSVALHLKKEGWRDAMNTLDKVLADKEPADDEGGAGTCPLLCIGPVCIVDWQGNFSPFQLSPFLLKILSPGRQFPKTTCFNQ